MENRNGGNYSPVFGRAFCVGFAYIYQLTAAWCIGISTHPRLERKISCRLFHQLQHQQRFVMSRLDTSSEADCDGDKALLASVESVHSDVGSNEGEIVGNCDAHDAEEPLPSAMSAMFEASARGGYQVTKKLTSRFVRVMKSFPVYTPVVEGGMAMVLDMEDMDHLHRCREQC
jgi:hypothetical protein